MWSLQYSTTMSFLERLFFTVCLRFVVLLLSIENETLTLPEIRYRKKSPETKTGAAIQNRGFIWVNFLPRIARSPGLIEFKLL